MKLRFDLKYCIRTNKCLLTSIYLLEPPECDLMKSVHKGDYLPLFRKSQTWGVLTLIDRGTEVQF